MDAMFMGFWASGKRNHRDKPVYIISSTRTYTRLNILQSTERQEDSVGIGIGKDTYSPYPQQAIANISKRAHCLRRSNSRPI